MLSAGEWISVLINLAVGLYLAVYYPRKVAKLGPPERIPPAFKWLARVLGPAGYLLMLGTLLYVAYRLLDV